MSEKICPVGTHIWQLDDSRPPLGFRVIDTKSPTCCGDNCQLWDSGDCGLKVARGVPADRYKEMWRTLQAYYHEEGMPASFEKMDKIEAEMGEA